jgi:hypothetical protein
MTIDYCHADGCTRRAVWEAQVIVCQIPRDGDDIVSVSDADGAPFCDAHADAAMRDNIAGILALEPGDIVAEPRIMRERLSDTHTLPCVVVPLINPLATGECYAVRRYRLADLGD